MKKIAFSIYMSTENGVRILEKRKVTNNRSVNVFEDQSLFNSYFTLKSQSFNTYQPWPAFSEPIQLGLECENLWTVRIRTRS